MIEKLVLGGTGTQDIYINPRLTSSFQNCWRNVMVISSSYQKGD